MNALLAIACICAVVGARYGNRTSLSLLWSAIYSSALCELGVPFHPALWLAIDLTVIMWVAISWLDAVAQGKYGKKRDIVILALFAFVWPLYFIPVSWGHDTITGIVCAQMILTFPFRRTWDRIRSLVKRSEDDTTTLKLMGA